MNTVDPLSLFISHLSPKCEVFTHVQLNAPWGIAEAKQDTCSFSFVIEGNCIVELINGRVINLEAGQLLLLPYGSAHKVMSEKGVKCLQSSDVFIDAVKGSKDNLVIGGAGKACHMMCGCFVFSPIQHWSRSNINAALPETIIIDAPKASKLETILVWIYEENKTNTSGSYLAQKVLLELLLIQILRSLDITTFNPSWLLALHDRFLAPVMLAIQEQLIRDWTVDELAAISALSKSSFSSRFKQITNMSPLNFVRQWRCLVAAKLLVSTDKPLKLITAECGFQSIDVLIRNFRQFYEMTPIQYRKLNKEIV